MTGLKPRILISQQIEADALEQFEAYADLVLEYSLSRSELIERLKQVDAAVLMLTNRLDSKAFEQLQDTRLQIIANHAVGVDNLDLKAASQANIWLTNTPDVLSDATAELALTLMLTLLRRVDEGQTLARSGHWHGWEPTQLLGHSLIGKTLGIIGAGRIGQRLADLASGFKLNLLYHNRQPDFAFETRSGAQYCDLDQICRQSDILTLHLPGGAETQHIINAERLALMKPQAILINTGRGNSIDQAALTDALIQAKIAGAALDVFEFEPEISKGLREMTNVVLTPHLGSATVQTRHQMAMICLQNIQAVLTGHQPLQAVNFPNQRAVKAITMVSSRVSYD